MPCKSTKSHERGVVWMRGWPQWIRDDAVAYATSNITYNTVKNVETWSSQGYLWARCLKKSRKSTKSHECGDVWIRGWRRWIRDDVFDWCGFKDDVQHSQECRDKVITSLPLSEHCAWKCHVKAQNLMSTVSCECVVCWHGSGTT